jgi:DNA-binding CsgD family transcriptional regulator
MSQPDVVGHLEGAPDVSIEGFLEFHRALQKGISDLHVEILEATADREKVVVHWRMTGKHTGPLMGVPASGRPVDETGMTKFHIVGGRVREGWDSWNLNAFLDRLAEPNPALLTKRHGLTKRQAEVALLMAERKSAKRIASELGISHNTARRHCQAVLRRLGLHSRTEVAEALGI